MGNAFEKGAHASDKSDHHASEHSPESKTPAQITPSDNQVLLQSRAKSDDIPPQFGTPNIFDSEKLHPQGAFSPEGPAAKQFDGLGPNGSRRENGVLYMTSQDADGTQHRVIRDQNKDTRTEDILRPDGTTQSIKSERNFREEKTFNEDGTLRTDKVADDRSKKGQDNQGLLSTKEYDHGKPISDSSSWTSADGQWHEHIWMKDSEGKQWSDVTDGNTTVKRTTEPDGSWTQRVQTRDVVVTDPATGKSYKTMTVEDTQSPK